MYISKRYKTAIFAVFRLQCPRAVAATLTNDIPMLSTALMLLLAVMKRQQRSRPFLTESCQFLSRY